MLTPNSTPDITPGAIRYIKLGRSGVWADQAIQDGAIPFGYRQIDHAACAAGEWDDVRGQLIAIGRTPSGASQGVREIRDFYDLGDDTLWVTLAQGHLWWAFAPGPVLPVADSGDEGPSRYRRTRDGWHRHSLTGEALSTRTLSSALTRVGAYRATICAVDCADYLLRRIRGEDEPLHAEAAALHQQMCDIALRMIRQLHWKEFETLVDLIFARNGWRRSSVLGEVMPDVDLLLDHPATGETAWVQVKTGTRQSDLDDYLDRYGRDGSCDRFFFVCHSPAGALHLPEGPRRHLWTGTVLANAAIEGGLFGWLMDRTR